MEENKKKKPKCSRWCSVPQCKFVHGISLHKYPEEEKLRKKWVIACKIGKQITSSMFVCAAHFNKEDYIPRWDGKKKRLKFTAVPSQNLPIRPLDRKLTPSQIKRKEARAARAAKRLKREDSSSVLAMTSKVLNDINNTKTIPKKAAVDNVDSRSLVEVVYNVPQESPESKVPRRKLPNIIRKRRTVENQDHTYVNSNRPDVQQHSPIRCSCNSGNELNCEIDESYETKAARVLVELNVKVYEMMKNEEIVYPIKDIMLKRVEEFYYAARRFQKTKFISFMKSNHQLHSYAGIDFQLLKNLTEAMTVCERDCPTNYERTAEERIFLCLIKIRLNLSFQTLATLFYLSEKDCKTVFYSTLQSLKIILRSAIYWPTKDDISKKLPEGSENFKETTAVMDRTEVTVDCPKCSKCKLPLPSTYNGGEILKILFGFAKCGLITYVGKALSGRASNETITDENFISTVLIPNCDAIMFDGFFIEEECNKVFIRLIKANDSEEKYCPDGKFKNQDDDEDRIQIAVEHFNKFKILQSKITCDMATYIDDLTVVISGIVNLSNPVFVYKRF